MDTYLIILIMLVASAICGLSNKPGEIGAEDE